MRRLVLVSMIVLLVAAACGADPATDGAAPGVGPPAGELTQDGVPGEVNRSCGGVQFGTGPVDLSRFEPFTGDIGAYMDAGVRAEYEASREWWESMDWSVVEETADALTLFGQVREPAGEEPPFGSVEFKMGPDGWRAAGWGGCRIVAAAAGFGVATFELDPAQPPNPADATLFLLATERECAGGRAPVDRQVVPVVIETGDTVEITVLVESPVGAQTCPSNPAFPLAVQLSGPLGARLIRDAAFEPGEDRPWPPSAAAPVLSLQTAGDAPSPGTANVVAWEGEPAGALLFGADGWSSDPTWFQTFGEPTPTAITGFVTSCDGVCEEECEGAACDALPRLGAECTMPYTALPGHEITMTVRFTGAACSIDVETTLID